MATKSEKLKTANTINMLSVFSLSLAVISFIVVTTKFFAIKNRSNIPKIKLFKLHKRGLYVIAGFILGWLVLKLISKKLLK